MCLQQFIFSHISSQCQNGVVPATVNVQGRLPVDCFSAEKNVPSVRLFHNLVGENVRFALPVSWQVGSYFLIGCILVRWCLVRCLQTECAFFYVPLAYGHCRICNSIVQSGTRLFL